MKRYATIARQYAEAVVSGAVAANKYTRLACKRFLDDLERRRFAFVLDEEKAARACSFIEHLPHVKGDWAKRRELLRLEPWQIFAITNIFGWVHKSGSDKGLRRFRLAYWQIPRKNAKSTTAAGVGLYMGTADGEEGAEVYCGATTEDQAWEVFGPIKKMVERTPALRQALDLQVYSGSILQTSTGSIIQPVVGKPGDGASPSCAIIDEYHEHDSPDQFDTMQTGMGARSQPLLLVTTTAGESLDGPCYNLYEESTKILEGIIDEDEVFPLIFGIDEGDDWTTEAALLKANPNAGVSVRLDYLKSQQRQAIRNSAKSGIFRTKHLNEWVASRSPYFNIEYWKKCARPDLTLEKMKGEECILFIDLASKVDLAALVIVFRRSPTEYVVIPRFWLPEDRVNEVKNVPYRAWAEDGYLITTPGNIIDYEFIEEEMKRIASLVKIREVAYDPFQATQFATRMTAEGFPMVEYGATVKNFSEPMKEVDKLILAQQIIHDGNPVLTWCMSNVVAKVDAKDNVFPRRPRKESKIDGAVALIGAIGKWIGVAIAEEERQFFVGL